MVKRMCCSYLMSAEAFIVRRKNRKCGKRLKDQPLRLVHLCEKGGGQIAEIRETNKKNRGS